jgi:trehalose 6-phosphate phosphatase
MRDETTDTTVDGSALTAALAGLDDAPRLLVALDFDGTLAPFADDPGHVGALPGSWATRCCSSSVRASSA